MEALLGPWIVAIVLLWYILVGACVAAMDDDTIPALYGI